jgi:hypothetical protein
MAPKTQKMKCIPANNDFFGVDTLMQLKHGAMVVDVHCHLQICKTIVQKLQNMMN